jgi:soluble lytic murein transglycosylase-like protein
MTGTPVGVYGPAARGATHRRGGRILANVGRGIRVAGVSLAVCIALAAGPSSAGSLAERAARDYAAGRPLQAASEFAQAALEDRGSARLALWAGVASASAGVWREAAAWFAEALRRPHSVREGEIARAWLARISSLFAPPPAARGPVSLWIAGLAKASNPRLTDGQARWIGQAVVAAARREGLDPWLLASVIYVESRFNHQSVSWAGAMGLGQLMPETAAAAGVDPRDPWGNILGAAEVLRWNYLEFRSWPLALAAYNAGADAVRRWGGVPPYAETQWYVRAVLHVYGQLARLGSA